MIEHAAWCRLVLTPNAVKAGLLLNACDCGGGVFVEHIGPSPVTDFSRDRSILAMRAAYHYRGLQREGKPGSQRTIAAAHGVTRHQLRKWLGRIGDSQQLLVDDLAGTTVHAFR